MQRPPACLSQLKDGGLQAALWSLNERRVVWNLLENLIFLLGLLLCQLHLSHILQKHLEKENIFHNYKGQTITDQTSPVSVLRYLFLPKMSGLTLKFIIWAIITRRKGVRVCVCETDNTLTTHTVMLESAEPVTILSSLVLAWRPQTLSWWASSVFTHSLVFMVQSFTKPSEPLRSERSGKRWVNPSDTSSNFHLNTTRG